MRVAIVGLLVSIGWSVTMSTAMSAIEHDPHTLILAFNDQVDGRALADSIRGNKNALPRNVQDLQNAGIHTLQPIFPYQLGVGSRSAYDSLKMAQYFVARLQANEKISDARTRIESIGSVSMVSLNHSLSQLESKVTPSDPLFPLQWHYSKIRLPEAWGITVGSSQITIAVLDDGFDFLHPDLGGTFRINLGEYQRFAGVDDDGNGLIDDVLGWDFGDDDYDVYGYSPYSHGTHVAGTIAALTNNGTGVSGVDWNAYILPIRVFNSIIGSALEADIAAGLYYAAIMGADVVNMSIGFYGYSSTINTALNYDYLQGMICVAATGNDDSSVVMYPASSVWTIAVGATDAADERYYHGPTSGSNYGAWVDFVAPGDGILSTYPTWYTPSPSYGFNTGTSMATPHVTGLASLILSVRPNLSFDSLYAYIRMGCDDERGLAIEDTPGWDPYHGYGRINAYNSIRLALGQCVCKCFGDPDCDGLGPDILDVTAVIDEVFRGIPVHQDFGCPAQRVDLNNDGATDVFDITAAINVAFRGMLSTTVFVDPCE